MTSLAGDIRDRLGHRHDATSYSGYVVLRCPLVLAHQRAPLRLHGQSGRPISGQTSVVTRSTVKAGGISRQQEFEEY